MSLICSGSNSVSKPTTTRTTQQYRRKISEPLQPADVVVGNNAAGPRAVAMHAASLTTTTASYWTNSQGTGGEGCCSELYKPPYMDVQTVKTNLTVDQAAKLEGQSHCLLLVEPVLLPDLGHTGVTKEVVPGGRRLFYPNGCKNCGLGSTIRNTLYESTSSRPTHRNGSDYSSTNNFGFYPKHQRHHQQQSQQPPSDWASSSAYHTPPDSYSSAGGGSKHSKLLAAVPSGQGGVSLTDVWGPPSGLGAVNKSNCRHREIGSNSGAARVDRTLGQTAGTGESQYEEVSLECSAQRNVSKGNALPTRQSRSGSNPAVSESRNSTSGTSKVSLGSAWGGVVDAGGRDSEWAAERRAADREAKEVVGALRHNSTRLLLLVGGGV